MASTPSDRLGLRLIGTGDFQDTWGSSLNSDALSLIDEGIAGVETIALSGDVTLSTTQYVSNQSRNRVLRFTNNSLSGTPTVTLPATERFYIIHNALGGTYGITFSNGSATVSVAANITTALIWQTGSVLYGIDLATGTDVATVAPQITNNNLQTVAGQIAPTNNLGTVAGISANVTTVAGISGNVTTVAGISSNVTTVAGISSAVSGVNAIASDVTAVNTDPLKTNITNVSGNATNINAVAGNATNINTVAGIDANVTTVAGISAAVSGVNAIASDVTGVNNIASNVTTVAGNNANVTTVAGISSDVTGVANISSAVTGVNTISSAVSSVNSNATNINAVAGNSTNINAVNANATNINTVAGISSNVTTVATNVTDVNNFADLYQIASSPPSTDGGGNALSQGDLFFDTSASELKIFNGSAFQGGVTATGNLLAKSSNLSDLANATTARTNLGLDPLLAAKAPLASPALTGSPTVNGVAIATGTSDSTLGTLTQAFTAGQTSTINLSANALSPSVAVTKEVPQTGVTNNQWNVDSAGSGNYTRYNTAPATTISFSGTTATLGTGSFSASDVGKTIEVNNGKLILTNANGTFSVASTPDNYNQAASGSWQMYGLTFNTADTDLELSNVITDKYDILNHASFTYLQSFSSISTIAQPMGMAFNPSGSKFYTYCKNQQQIYEFDLTTNFDPRTATLRATFSTSSNFNNGSNFAMTPDGSRVFFTTDQGRLDTYSLSTPFDITTCTNFAMVRNLGSSTESESAPKGLAFSPDGTYLAIVGESQNKVFEYSFSTGFNPSTISYLRGTSVGAISPRSLMIKPDGSEMYIVANSGGVRVYPLGTNFNFSTATSYAGGYAVGSNSTGSLFNADGSQMYLVNSTSYLNRFEMHTVGNLLTSSGYHAAHTANSIDSTTWTDINSMTATESAGTGSVNYAVSTDDRTTWKIAHNTNGARNIVKNASGTWQYNSNATYASETWVNGTTNNELATLQQAMEGAQLAVNAYNTNNAGAGYDSNVWNVGINPKGMALTPDGNTVFIMSDTQNNIKSYSMPAPFDMATTPSNTGSFSYASDFTTENGFCFADSGTKLYILGINAGTFLWQYSLSTAYDLSTVSYVRKLDIDSVTGDPQGVAFKTDGSKMFIIDENNDALYEWSLTTNFDISTASNTANFSVASESGSPKGLYMSDDGTRFFFVGATDNKVRGYTMSTAWDVTSASLTISTDISSYVQSGSVTEITFNPLGTIMFIADYNLSSGRITRFVLGSSTFTNQMNKSQLDAVSDANQFALSDDLDLAIILNLSSGSGVPSSDGVSINYDANVANQGAILGTDYNYDVPALNKVRITAVNAATLKVRVV